MNDVRSITTRAIHDALALRGLDDGGGFIRTTDPRDYLTGDRLRLAQAVLAEIPAGASPGDAKTLADKLLPVVARMLQPQTRPHDDPPGRIMFLS